MEKARNYREKKDNPERNGKQKAYILATKEEARK